MSAAQPPASPASVPNVFLGTSEFAADVLAALASSRHRPALVVTPPDRPRGRGRRTQPPPAAERAEDLGLPVHRTANVNEPASRAAIAEHRPELATVCAFGQLIAEPLLGELPMLNVHPSLLPRWRGAAPIERAIMAGDERTGVCLIRLTAGLDSGPVALRRECAVGPDEDYGPLAARLARLGGELLVDGLDAHAAGALTYEEQSESGVTYAEKIEPAERRFERSGEAIAEARRIRALTPHIGAYAELAGGERLGLRSPLLRPELELGAGEFAVDPDGGGLLLGCVAGGLRIGEVQPAGGRWMDAADYLRGRGLPPVVQRG